MRTDLACPRATWHLPDRPTAEPRGSCEQGQQKDGEKSEVFLIQRYVVDFAIIALCCIILTHLSPLYSPLLT